MLINEQLAANLTSVGFPGSELIGDIATFFTHAQSGGIHANHELMCELFFAPAKTS